MDSVCVSEARSLKVVNVLSIVRWAFRITAKPLLSSVSFGFMEKVVAKLMVCLSSKVKSAIRFAWWALVRVIF